MRSDNYGLQGFNVLISPVAAGVIDRPPVAYHSVGINVGPPARVRAARDGCTDDSIHEILAVDIAPAGMRSCVEVEWEQGSVGDVLFLRLTPAFLETVAAQSDWKGRRPDIPNEFRFRDPQIERIGLLFHSDIETEHSNGRLYGESLATAFGVHLLRRYAGGRQVVREPSGGLGKRRMRRVVEYIEAHLSEDITLTDLAEAVGLGLTQFRTLFKQSAGMAPHQYVIMRRVERARELLLRGDATAGEAAINVGFSDQSHLTRHMRRRLGVTPGTLVNSAEIDRTF